MNVDLLIEHATQLITVASPGGPKRGTAMRDLGIIDDGALAVADGQIVAVGPTAEVLAQVRGAARRIDARGKAVLPGFVDAHTHVVFAGDRALVAKCFVERERVVRQATKRIGWWCKGTTSRFFSSRQKNRR